MKLKIDDVLKKDLRILCFLIGSWLVGLVALYFTKDERWLGLVPAVNYLAYRLEQELKNEGYRKVLGI